MADAIAEALNKDFVQTFEFMYEGDVADILWTGEDLIRLEILDKVPENADIANMTAEQIAKNFYRAVPRIFSGDISVIDRDRIAVIETGLPYYEEIIFMCQPTCEGEALVQAIKMYFGIEAKTRNIVLELMSRVEIISAVIHGFNSNKLDEYRSDKFMRELVGRDICPELAFSINYAVIGSLEIKLLQSIARFLSEDTLDNRAHRDKTSDGKRKTTIGGLLDIDKLFVSMSAIYDMDFHTLWDGLLYLYAKGMISNPMTHIQPSPEFGDVVGWGNPERPSWEDICERTPRSHGGIYTMSVDDSIIGIPFDGEDSCEEHFLPKVSAIYSYIVSEQKRVSAGEDAEAVVFPSIEENDSIHISCLNSRYVNGDNEYKTNSKEYSFGMLIYNLICAGLTVSSGGLLKITDAGKEFLNRIDSVDKMSVRIKDHQ